MTLTEVVATLTVLLTLIVWTQRRWRRGRRRPPPPGPWGLPVLGYLPWLDPARPYKTLTSLASKFGPVFSLKMGSVDCVVVADNNMIRDLFSKEAVSGRPPLYLFSQVMEDSGIIFSQSDTWREQRRFAGQAMRKQGKTSHHHHRIHHPDIRSDGAGAGQVAVPHHGGDDGAVRRPGRD